MKITTWAIVAAFAAVLLTLVVADVTRGRRHLASAIYVSARTVITPAPRRKPSAGLAPPSPEPPPPINRITLEQIGRMKDPISRRRMMDRAKIRIATSRRQLLHMLQPISPDKLGRVSEILAAAELDTDIAMLELHAVNPSPSGKQVESVLAAQSAARDADARDVLDDAQYAQYVSYWESEPFTQTINQIADVMRAQGSNISPELQQQMLTTYASAQKLAQQAISSPSDNGSSSAADQATVADQYIADALSRILSPDDFKAFMNAQNKINFGN
jgi:hypothetical protein